MEQGELIGQLLAEEPRVEVRQQLLPAPRIVLALVFDRFGKTITVPFFSAQAHALGECLIEYADDLAQNERGGLN